MKKNRMPSIRLWAAASALFLCLAAHAGNYKAKAQLDSTAMIMGSKTTLSVEFTGPLQNNAHTFIDEKEWAPVEVTSSGNAEVKDFGNNQKMLRQEFIVQCFDSGLYTLPPVYCISGSDTIPTEAVVLKIDPISLDTANVIFEGEKPVDVKVHDYTGVESIKLKILDFMPDWISAYWWWILIAILVIGAAIFVYMKWLRHGRIPLVPVKKPIPPYELAISKLDELQSKQLWQKGAEKEYYTQLTDILRAYLHGRFGINAKEMTSYQILEAVRHTEIASEYLKPIQDVLSEADFVKFAKAKPLPAENEHAFSSTKEFVESTKPLPEPDENEDNKEAENRQPDKKETDKK